MFDSLGIGGGGSLIAGVACLLAPIPFVFYKYGEPIRKRSRFAPTEQQQEQSPQDQRSESTDEEAMDEEQGVPNQHELEQEIKEKKWSASGPSSSSSEDRYLDASGMEKAEPVSTR